MTPLLVLALLAACPCIGGGAARGEGAPASAAADLLYLLQLDVKTMEGILEQLETALDNAVTVSPPPSTTAASTPLSHQDAQSSVLVEWPPDKQSISTKKNEEQENSAAVSSTSNSVEMVKTWQFDQATAMAKIKAISSEVALKRKTSAPDMDCSSIKGELYNYLVAAALALDAVSAGMFSDGLHDDIQYLNAALDNSRNCIEQNDVPLFDNDKQFFIAATVSVRAHVDPAKYAIATALHPPPPVRGLPLDSAFMITLMVLSCVVAALLVLGVAAVLHRQQAGRRQQLLARRRTTQRARALSRRTAANQPAATRTASHSLYPGMENRAYFTGEEELQSELYTPRGTRRSGDWVKLPGPHNGWVNVSDSERPGKPTGTTGRPALAGNSFSGRY